MRMPRISRQFFLLVLVVVFLLLVAGSWWAMTSGPDAVEFMTVQQMRDGQVAPQAKVPVIIYLVDTLRADRLGVYGHEKTTSWRLDSLAKESVVFEQAYGPAPWTLPSVASVITSTFPCEHGLVDARTMLSPSIKTLAERLHAAGYLSGASYNNAFAGPMVGLNRGYDIINEHGIGAKEEGRATDVEAFLDQAGNRPFLLYVHTMELHDTYLTPYRFIRRFGQINPALMAEYPEFIRNYARLRHVDWKAGNPLGTTDNSAEQQALLDYFSDKQAPIELLYDAATLWADANVGEVIDVLKERKIWDQAIFIFLSDHGEELGDHGGWFHGQSVYEELVRVPLIMHFPRGDFAGQRIAHPVSLVDLMPTIFDYLEMPDLCSGCRGKSLLPLLRGAGESAEPRMTVPAVRINRINYFRPWKDTRGDVNVMMRRDNWKGIWNNDLESLELYNLEADPTEQADVSLEHAELAGMFSDTARRWQETCRSFAPPREKIEEIDEKTREQLRALGYFN
jgi:arylsulfatase A-like enzyme